MVLEVARIRAQIECDDHGVRAALREQHRGFLAEPPADFTLSVTSGPLPGARDGPATIGYVTGPAKAQFDFETLRGAVSAPPDRLLPTALGFLSAIYSHLLLRDKGLMLHAAAVEHAGAAYLLTGPSGAGKTTAARACQPATVLHDDLAALRSDEGGPWRVYPAPAWTGELHDPGWHEPPPVAAVFSLRQGDPTTVRPLALPEAVARLLVAPAGLTPDALWHNLLARCEAVGRGVPGFELTFTPGVPLLPLLAAAALAAVP